MEMEMEWVREQQSKCQIKWKFKIFLQMIYQLLARDESRTPADSHSHTHTHTPSTAVKVAFFVWYDKDMLVFCPGFLSKPSIFLPISPLIRLKADVRHSAKNKNQILHSRKILLDNYTTFVCTNAGIQTKFRPFKM